MLTNLAYAILIILLAGMTYTGIKQTIKAEKEDVRSSIIALIAITIIFYIVLKSYVESYGATVF